MPPRQHAARGSRRAALPTPSERALARLKALGLRCIRGETSGVSGADARSALDDVEAVLNARGFDDLGLWLAVSEDGVAPLLALFALALRRSCPRLDAAARDSDTRAAFGALRSRLSAQLILPGAVGREYGSIPRLKAITTTLVRAHTLRCYAAHMACTAEQLAQAAAVPRRTVQAVMDLLQEARQLVVTCMWRMEPRAGQGRQRHGAPINVFEELGLTRYMDHWARLLVVVVGHGWEHEAAAELHAASKPSPDPLGVPVLWPLVDPFGLTWPLADYGGPCTAYLIASHLARLCALLDGGTSYGLGGAAGQHAAPLLDPSGRCFPAGAAGGVGTLLAQRALIHLKDSLRDPASTPTDGGAQHLRRHLAFALDVSLRLAACAAEALGVPPAKLTLVPGRGEAHAGGPHGRPHVHVLEAVALAVAALTCAQHILTVKLEAAKRPPPQLLQRVSTYWRVTLAVLPRLPSPPAGVDVPREQAWRGYEVSDLLDFWLPGTCQGIAPAPSVDVAAALAGGYVAATERLLRRHGGGVGSIVSGYFIRGAAASLSGLSDSERKLLGWAHLLAHGDARQTASLVASAAKLQRRCTSLRGRQEGWVPEVLTLRVMCKPVRLAWLASNAPPQLGLLVSWCALQVVPALQSAMHHLTAPMGASSCEEADAMALVYVLSLALDWAAVLPAAAAVHAHAAAAHGRDGPAAAEAAAGWRDLLLRGLRPGPLLALAVDACGMLDPGRDARQQDDMPDHEDMPGKLSAALSALAHLLPSDLAALVRDADAAAAAPAAAAADSGAGGAPASSAAPLLTTALLRRVVGPGGPCHDAALFAAVERALSGGDDGGADGLPALNAAALPAELRDAVAAAAALPPLAEARALLRTCSNPSCVNMAGPSEAALQLRPCEGGCCGRAHHCSAECVAEHLRAGHAAECKPP